MNLHRHLTIWFVISCLIILSVVTQVSGERNISIKARFSTKHGELTFVEDNECITDARLDGQTILTSANRKDGWGYTQSLMLSDFAFPYQVSAKSKPTDKPLKIDRIVVSEGRDGTCINQFVILDFTSKKPFVSDRFGYNPDGRSCLKFIRAKWGKKKSYIYIEGPQKFIYYSSDRVVDADTE